MLVDFRQDDGAEGFEDFFTLFDEVPYFRLNEEAAGAGFLRSVGKGVQPDDGGSVFRQPLQIFPDEFLRRFTFDVDVDLLFVTGTPDLFLGAVGKVSHSIGGPGLSFIDGIHLFLSGFAVLPEVFVTDE